ncbi:hypothetical protein BMF94_3779 [Rhodotorula taiwanensis]|uniref:Uncharacterized protein n=1 Tax=Rhodotorula taiwanensis TaxID=741276 RepID=A0A2S5B8R3_9BASI|nr:hypothetical protein BMF94_3779 [Rhodotorula taiwanensis]
MPSNNNPFAPSPPTEVSQAAHRFPDVLNQDPDLQLRHQQQPYGLQAGYGQQSQGIGGGMMMGGQYGQPQGQGMGGYGGGGGGGGGGLVPQQTGYGYSSPSPVPGFQQPQYTGYQMYGGGGGGGGGGQPQSQQPYQSDLDPYSSLGSSSFAATSNQSSGPNYQQQQQGGGGTLLAVQQTQSHPRDYVHENKAQLMVWDEYAWKQLFSRNASRTLASNAMASSQALREAWESRLASLRAASNSGADPTSVLSLKRDAEDKVDSIHASKMQLDEVKTGWRHSTDTASKARVREALNAGLSSLPSYPSPVHPSQLGGSFNHQLAKDSIMSQYGGAGGQQQQQQPQQGYMQSQQTGFGYGGMQGGQMQMGMGMQPQMTGYGGSGMGMGMGMQPQMTGFGGGAAMPQQQQHQQMTGFGGGAGGGYGGGGGYY